MSKKPDKNATARDHYDYALKHGACEDTRQGACKDPCWAYWYARDVDKASHEDTRKAACKDAFYSYLYALDVDKASRDDTRQATFKDPCSAYCYAVHVDKAPREDTFKAAKGSEYEEDYLDQLGKPV